MHVGTFSSADREVIERLYANDGWVDLYSLHEQYLLSPGQIADIMDRLVRAAFAEIDGINARLTPDGRAWVIAARQKIFLVTDRAVWRPDADAILQDQLDPEEPYLPDSELVDRGFFALLGMDNAARSAKL